MTPLNFVGYLLGSAIMSPINLINSFLFKGHTNEKFADNFASAYGYGPEISSAITSGKYEMNFTLVDKYINYIPILGLINKTSIDILRFVGSLTDEHPTEVQRAVSQIQFYKAELEKGDYPKEIKQQLKNTSLSENTAGVEEILDDDNLEELMDDSSGDGTDEDIDE